MPEMEDKIRLVEAEFAFFLDAPITESAQDFPSPEDFIENWYLTATVFKNLRIGEKIGERDYEALMNLIGDAEAEYAAAKMLGEAPDTDELLGVGYDEEDVPSEFVAKYQAAIWREVIAVHDQDKRPAALTRIDV